MPRTASEIKRIVTETGENIMRVKSNAVCSACGETFTAREFQMTDDSWQVEMNGRCPKCQTKHLTNRRVEGYIKANKNLKNLKLRLSDSQRSKLKALIIKESTSLIDLLDGVVATETAGFDIGD